MLYLYQLFRKLELDRFDGPAGGSQSLKIHRDDLEQAAAEFRSESGSETTIFMMVTNIDLFDDVTYLKYEHDGKFLFSINCVGTFFDILIDVILIMNRVNFIIIVCQLNV